jgi:hypothetical protein
MEAGTALDRVLDLVSSVITLVRFLFGRETCPGSVPGNASANLRL